MSYSDFRKLQLEMLQLERRREELFEEWRLECNEKGLEIYYDDANANLRGLNGAEILVGKWTTRPCSSHRKGHRCNPPMYPQLTGLVSMG